MQLRLTPCGPFHVLLADALRRLESRLRRPFFAWPCPCPSSTTSVRRLCAQPMPTRPCSSPRSPAGSRHLRSVSCTVRAFALRPCQPRCARRAPSLRSFAVYFMSVAMPLCLSFCVSACAHYFANSGFRCRTTCFFCGRTAKPAAKRIFKSTGTYVMAPNATRVSNIDAAKTRAHTAPLHCCLMPRLTGMSKLSCTMPPKITETEEPA